LRLPASRESNLLCTCSKTSACFWMMMRKTNCLCTNRLWRRLKERLHSSGGARSPICSDSSDGAQLHIRNPHLSAKRRRKVFPRCRQFQLRLPDGCRRTEYLSICFSAIFWVVFPNPALVCITVPYLRQNFQPLMFSFGLCFCCTHIFDPAQM
jgi:hypothetical protein